MVATLSLYLAQMNPTVGAIEANAQAIKGFYARGKDAGADLVVTPELSLVGYPPEDLVLKPFFVRAAAAALQDLADITKSGPALMVGLPWSEDGKLYNAVAMLVAGEVSALRFKHDLPNYGVFDEKRIFASSDAIRPFHFRDFSIGAMVCEDMWETTCTDRLSAAGIDLLLVPTCSPYAEDKREGRWAEARARAVYAGKPLVFCNQVGGQDELVFDGASFVMDAKGEIVHQMQSFDESESLITFEKKGTEAPQLKAGEVIPVPDRMGSLYGAAVLGLRDYVQKNHFPGVVLGMSGGIDSALSAAIAADALGVDKVKAIMLPSDYTSNDSLEDAEACAKALGIDYSSIPIKKGVDALGETLSPLFEGTAADTTEENLQSRLRGVILMAVSNKFGHMVLTTGNKSEVSVGYATLYGDMCGGYNAIKDIYKLDVFALSRWRNTNKPNFCLGNEGPVIPDRIIEKPPTAELRPDQRDDDNLPPYETLDPILKGLVEEDLTVSDIIDRGFERSDVERVEHLLYIAEYKRRQAAPGVKISEKLFGRDRRYPITNGFRTARFHKE